MDLKVNNISFGTKPKNNIKITQKVTGSIPKETVKTTSKFAKKILYTATTLIAMGGSFVAGLFTNKPQKEIPTPVVQQQNVPAKVIKDTLNTYTPPEFVVVKEGDCVWNIAKDIISENGKKAVTDPEIYKKHNEILKANGLKYFSEYDERVFIHKGDTLFTTMDAKKKDIAKKLAKLITTKAKI